MKQPLIDPREDIFTVLQRNGLLFELIKGELNRKKINVIDVSEEKQDATLNDFFKSQKLNKQEDIDKWINSRGVSMKQLKEQTKEKIQLEELIKRDFFHKVESRFLKQKDNYEFVVYSLIRTTDHEKARELHLQLIDGEAEFGDLAKEHSEGNEKITRGIVGPSPLIKAHPSLVKALKSIKTGEIHNPLRIENYTIIVRLEYYKEAILDETTKSAIANEIYQDFLTNEAQEVMKDFLQRVNSKTT